MHTMTKLKIAAIGLGLLLSVNASVAAGDGYDASGLIYGTVETDSGNEYTGFLRWGTEEAAWGDLFNSTKEDLPYLEKMSKESRRKSKIKILGVTVGYRWESASSGRSFISRFGDIKEIVPGRGEKFDLLMQSGARYSMEGGSNDIGAKITVTDRSLGEVQLDWRKIERIAFKPTPRDAVSEAYRLYGTVTTDHGEFEGYVQWDVQECLSVDKLDGDTDDGDVSIEMGRVRSIEKHNRNGSYVELKDGRRMLLEDSNDVDSDLRGIFVDDDRFGRVRISWDAFEKIEFRETGKSGAAYDTYGGGPINGTVVDYEGRTFSGHLVFDLDETETWELLNGDLHDVEYNIPFSKIRALTPGPSDTSVITLKNGDKLELSDGQDVSERNAGVVVLRDNGRETYLRWDEIERIDFR